MVDPARRNAGVAAADAVPADAVVGLGTGATAGHAIVRLGQRVREEGLRIRGVPTSRAAERLALDGGIPLIDFSVTTDLDLAIDGADEVDPDGCLIKGGGGALLREKVVAHRARLVIIVVDPSKLVSRLGLAFRLPIEVVPFAWPAVAAEVRGLGALPELRREAGGTPFTTDNGNWILDLKIEGGIPQPAALEAALDRIPGVVETGIFVGLANQIIVGHAHGVEVRELPRT